MRLLLKLSGEALSGEGKKGYDPTLVQHIVSEIRSLLEEGHEIGVVVGAGNLIRGKELHGMSPVVADQIGMLGTLMNAIYLKETLQSHGIGAIAISAISNLPSFERLTYEGIDAALRNKKVVVFGGGTSNPLFTTDTAAALRAAEMGAKLILKATKVDGVYDKDPKKFPDAKKFDRLSFDEAIKLGLKVMDLEAFMMCKKMGIDIVVFDFFKPGNCKKAVFGKTGTLVTS